MGCPNHSRAAVRKPAHKWARRLGIVIAAGSVGLVVMVVLFQLLLRWVPLPAVLFEPPQPALEFTDHEGRLLREAGVSAAWGKVAVLRDIPGALVDATLAAEDRRFWRHHGVDWQATARAAWSCARHGRVVSGGSTITQQLIKSYVKRPRAPLAKAMEALQALRLEQIWSKEKILVTYLNRLDYGNRRRGPVSAARYYFDLPLSDLSKAQAAFLAGLPQAPSRLNPRRNVAAAQKRQAWILDRMAAVGFLSAAEHARALAEPLRLAAARRNFCAPHFVDLILRRHREGLDLMNGKVATSLDLELNQAAEKILRNQLSRLQAQHVENGSLVVLDNRTGEVRALVGSENYFAPGDGQVNGAWAPRSAGSTFKPFTYAIALEQGATPATVAADIPTQFATPTGIFAPVNYRRRCHGPMRYRETLANSLNIPAVKVLESIGGAEVLQTRLKSCGLTTLNAAPDYYGLGLTIGNAEARLLELANAYACLARLGVWKPYRLLTGYDETNGYPAAARLFDAGTAYLIADILSDSQARALEFGGDSPLRFSFPVACKTGTSTDFRDNWALGYTPEYTVGVWVGNFDGSPMEQVSGVTGAAPMLHEMFMELHRRFGTSWYARPDGLVECRVHPITGKRLRSQTSGGLNEKFLAACLPEVESPADYDSLGRVRLPETYRDWFASGENGLGDQAVIDLSPGKQLAARIITPLPGTVFFLDPDLPDQGRRLNLRTEGLANPQWLSSSLPITNGVRETIAWLAPGKHELRAVDRLTGTSLRTWIEVRNR
jgi:penicillin-binding protein 1C